MKADLGGILVRVRYSNFIFSKQVTKVVGEAIWVIFLPPSKYLKPSQSQKPGRRNLLEQDSFLLFPRWKSCRAEHFNGGKLDECI